MQIAGAVTSAGAASVMDDDTNDSDQQ